MDLRRPLLAAATMVGLALAASPAMAQWHTFGGSFDCTGHSIGKNAVKLNCIQKVTRGNRIYTLTPAFKITGPVARRYLGKHKGCTHVPASQVRWKQDFVKCPGIPKWW